MSSSSEFGAYFRSFTTDVPPDLTSEEAKFLKRTLFRFPEEAVYVYSFKESRMIYADGFEEVIGYKDHQISMHFIVNTPTNEYAIFVHELNDKALTFIQKEREHLEKHSFSIEIKLKHKNGDEVPVIAKSGVYKAENGSVVSVICRFQINRSLNFGTVMRYSAFGPEKSEFEEELNKTLFYNYTISDKERQALILVAKGYSFKEIASNLRISHSAVEKRILPLYKRFNVKSLSHLVSFAYDNHILP